MLSDEQLARLITAAREGSRGIDRDKCLVLRDDLNELIGEFLELQMYARNKVSGA